MDDILDVPGTDDYFYSEAYVAAVEEMNRRAQEVYEREKGRGHDEARTTAAYSTIGSLSARLQIALKRIEELESKVNDGN